ncbi:hypothetical protein [Novispirillum itersonii]|uniref:Uncharacterized protein n=1 Tax=Novispirillum itersonii TaxID=189 RepID=A0A7X0DL92_NOVIT|nr:hypothetical protein [Novispirillum itersonii]MBB6209746.1 hypothetical protein [Novispirillum itersonii]
MALDAEDKAGAIGCLSALLAIGAVVGGVYFYQNVKISADPEPDPVAKKAPITKVQAQDPSRKTVVKEAAPVEKMARSVSTDSPPPTEDAPPPPPQKGVTAAVQDLGSVLPEQAPPPAAVPPEASQVQAVMEADPLCYQGRFARRTASLYGGDGFAITYGTDDRRAEGQRPRLEFFFNDINDHKFVTYLSLAPKAPRDFPNDHEFIIPWETDAINAVVAKWIVAIADGTCPAKPASP